jgi:hypothetical protein
MLTLEEDNKRVKYEVYHKDQLIVEFNNDIINIDRLNLSIFQITVFKTTNNHIDINTIVPLKRSANEYTGFFDLTKKEIDSFMIYFSNYSLSKLTPLEDINNKLITNLITSEKGRTNIIIPFT